MSKYTPKEQILSVVKCIPKGRVATYGQVADLAGLPGRARFAGKSLTSEVPWHRVLRADGKIAFPAGSIKADEQSQRLFNEGVVVKNLRVKLKDFGWLPDLPTLLSLPF